MQQEEILNQLSTILAIPVSHIDINASFIQMGGNSLSAVALRASCKSHRIYLDIENILRCPTISQLLDQATSNTVSKAIQNDSAQSSPTEVARIVEMSAMHSPAKASSSTAVSNNAPSILNTPTYKLLGNKETSSPITEMQLSFIQGSQRHPGTNVISYFETYHSEHIPLLREAWRTVIQLESIFRTKFDLKQQRLVLLKSNAITIPWVEAEVEDECQYQAALKVDLSHLSVSTGFRVVTLNTPKAVQRRSTIIWYVHHALVDGYSSQLLLAKVRRAAAGLSVSPSPPFVFLSNALWQLQSRSKALACHFWTKQRQKLSLSASDLALPYSSHQSSQNTISIDTISLQAPIKELQECAVRVNVTLASIYYAAWAMALSVYSDSESVVFGAVLSGRNLPLAEVEDTIGPMVNTLPFCAHLKRSLSTSELLRYIYTALIELSSFQYSTPQDGFERRFASTVGLEVETLIPEHQAIAPVSKPFSRVVSNVPLSVLLDTEGNVELQYNTSIYKRTDMESLSMVFSVALDFLMKSERSVGQCLDDFLPVQSQRDLLHLGNYSSTTTNKRSIQDDLVTLLERIVLEYPTLIAVQQGSCMLPYSDLYQAATRVAQCLFSLVNIGDVVCVYADRSINWIISIYGILKAGGVYCPIDASLPEQLQELNYASSCSKLFLVPSKIQQAVVSNYCSNLLVVEEILQGNDHSMIKSALGLKKPDPSSNAYLCFTSGSSGRPKGVLCSHQGLVAFQRDETVRLFAAPGRKISQLLSPAFDGSIHEIFSALSYGATLVMGCGGDPFEPLHLVDSALMTPSVAKMFHPEEFPALRTVYLVGEPVPQSVNDTWAFQKELYNMYGPTESTCGATIKRLKPGLTVTIGIPNPSTRVYILNRNGKLLPRGMVGEIYLAGVQVSSGYIGQSQETSQNFLSDTFCPGKNELMYRTGDRGFWNEQGEIVCLGRIDRQIKLRSFRLDLDDLEIRMCRAYPKATSVALAQKEDYLVCMITPASLSVNEFKSQIAKAIPAYAIPKRIQAVVKVPTTPIGKVDTEAVKNAQYLTDHYLPKLLDPAELKIAEAWQQTLGLPHGCKISSESNFVELGGNSLQQLLVSTKLGTVFNCEIPLRLVIESETLSKLARSIEALTNTKAPKKILGIDAVSPVEEDWWAKYQFCQDSSAFNVNFACRFDDRVNPNQLVLAWNQILKRHRILRCKFAKHPRNNIQKLYNQNPPQAKVVSHLNLRKEIHHSFDLRGGNLIRVIVSRYEMVVVASHIICDLTALEALLDEVAQVYNGSQLPASTQLYENATSWSNKVHRVNLEFWQKYLGNRPEPPKHFGFLSKRRTYCGSSYICKIPTPIFRSVVTFTEKRKITLHQIALGATALSLQPETDSNDIILGAPYFNRQSEDDVRTVGLFLEPLPIRVRHPCPAGAYPNGKSSSALRSDHDFIENVHYSSQAALSHAIPWNQLLRCLDIKSEFPDHPLFDVMVTVHDYRAGTTKLSLPGITPLYTWTEGAKFKLMLEFIATNNGSLLLRMEYDQDCFTQRDLLQIERLLIIAIEWISLEEAYEVIKLQLRKAKNSMKNEEAIGNDTSLNYFSKELNLL